MYGYIDINVHNYTSSHDPYPLHMISHEAFDGQLIIAFLHSSEFLQCSVYASLAVGTGNFTK